MAKQTNNSIKEKSEPEVKPVAVRVLNRYRIEKKKNDAYLYERVVLSPEYAGQDGVKQFVDANGNITYYVEKLVKKYSDNVVKS